MKRWPYMKNNISLRGVFFATKQSRLALRLLRHYVPRNDSFSLRVGRAIVFLFLLLSVKYSAALAASEAAPGADQQISDFSLAGYGDKGKKAWDISGKSADIISDTVKLKDVTGNLYGEKEDIQLNADMGDFNKTDGKVHLQDNVVITTSQGATLTTDSLDWDRKNQTVTTVDQVNIARDNMMAAALGASGEPNLKKVDLEKEVNVQIFPQEKNAEGAPENKATKITITCDGPLQVDYDAGIATFNNNVKVDRDDAQIYSDTLLVYFLNNKQSQDKEQEEKDAAGAEGVAGMGSKIDKIIARGNVKIVQGENISYSQEAVYSGMSKKITLVGKPRLVIYSTEEMSSNALAGD